MSVVTYKVGAKEYSFESRLQIKGISMIAVEENLNEEVKLDIQKNKPPHYRVHDITLVDDNGRIACAEDFTEIGNLKIVKR